VILKKYIGPYISGLYCIPSILSIFFFIPQIESSDDDELLPVIFWIHGGAFYAGDGGMEENGPEFLMDQPIVLVTINYRLGPFGKCKTHFYLSNVYYFSFLI
jgi:carboxylesterase type B